MNVYFKKHIVFTAFLVCFLLAACVFVPFMAANEGCFALSNDFIAQEIPFGMLMNNGIKSGALWNWGIDLGGNLLEDFGFYNIGSPFFLVTLPFPAAAYPFLTGWMMILKFACAGAAAAWWIRRYLKRPVSVLFGSVLYAFSGFAVIGIVFYHFLDVAALFPMMLASLDALMCEDRRHLFTLCCFLNLVTNPVFFFGSACFTVMYWLWMYAFPALCERRRGLAKKFGLCVLEALAGCLLGGVILVPVVVGLMGNERATALMSLKDGVFPTKSGFLLRVMAVFLPPENMNGYSAVCESAWGTWNLYLPACGSCFAIAYAIANKDRLSVFLRLLAVFVFVPLLGSLFLAFTKEEYGRWYYMLTLMMALASAKVFDGRIKGLKRACAVSALAVLGYIAATAVLGRHLNGGTGLIFRPVRYTAQIAAAFAGIGLCLVFAKTGSTAKTRRVFMGITALCCIAMLGVETAGYSGVPRDDSTPGFNARRKGFAAAEVAYVTEIGRTLDKDVLPYRFAFDEGLGCTFYNFAMTEQLPSTGSFLTTAEKGVFRLHKALGRKRLVMSYSTPEGVTELLGGKMLISNRRLKQRTETGTFETSAGQTFWFYENEDALPLGTVYTGYITQSEFASVKRKDRAAVMLKALVVPDEKEPAVSGVLSHEDDYRKITAEDLHAAAASHTLGQTLSFDAGKDSFRTEVLSQKEAYAFFSVPVSRWWHASVNGKPQEILDINGLMAVPVTAGTNEIVFDYEYTPFTAALWTSAAGALLWAGYAICIKKKSGFQTQAK